MNLSDLDISGELIALVAVVGGLTFLTLAVLGGVWGFASRSRERERTTREVAAYVAEGSIDAADAERLLIASRNPKRALDRWHKQGMERTPWIPPSA